MSVIFDQLRISDDGKRMYINIHVNEAEFFEDFCLDSITVTTADRVLETNPRSPSEDYLFYYEFSSDVHKASLVLNSSDFLRNWETDAKKMVFRQCEMPVTLFFVYVKIRKSAHCRSVWDITFDETFGPCVVREYDPCCLPCRLDEEYTLGVVFDENMLHQRVMQYVKFLGERCTIPKDFIDFILLWNAFKASVETEHYLAAIKFFKLLFDKRAVVGSIGSIGSVGSVGSVKKGCGCHG